MALCKFFTLKDPEKAPDKKNCVPSAKLRVLLPAKKGLPTGMKQHLERKHYVLYQQFKKLEVQYTKQKVIVI